MYEFLVNETVEARLSEEDLDGSESYSVICFFSGQIFPFFTDFYKF